MLSTRKITASRRNCFTANYFGASARQKARKRASKTYWRSSWNRSVSTLITWNIWRRTERSGVKFSNMERKSVKPDEMQQLSCAGNFRKVTAMSATATTILLPTSRRLFRVKISLISHLHTTDAFLNHKVDQMVLIYYDEQRRNFNFSLN